LSLRICLILQDYRAFMLAAFLHLILMMAAWHPSWPVLARAEPSTRLGVCPTQPPAFCSSTDGVGDNVERVEMMYSPMLQEALPPIQAAGALQLDMTSVLAFVVFI